jgi:hypothetical protein
VYLVRAHHSARCCSRSGVLNGLAAGRRAAGGGGGGVFAGVRQPLRVEPQVAGDAGGWAFA